MLLPLIIAFSILVCFPLKNSKVMLLYIQSYMPHKLHEKI